jgi:hypothetical protein
MKNFQFILNYTTPLCYLCAVEKPLNCFQNLQFYFLNIKCKHYISYSLSENVKLLILTFKIYNHGHISIFCNDWFPSLFIVLTIILGTPEYRKKTGLVTVECKNQKYPPKTVIAVCFRCQSRHILHHNNDIPNIYLNKHLIYVKYCFCSCFWFVIH